MTYPMQRTINVDSSMVETPFGLASYSSHINIYYCKPLIQYIINFFEQRVMRECNVNKNNSDENFSSVKPGIICVDNNYQLFHCSTENNIVLMFMRTCFIIARTIQYLLNDSKHVIYDIMCST